MQVLLEELKCFLADTNLNNSGWTGSKKGDGATPQKHKGKVWFMELRVQLAPKCVADGFEI